MRSKGGDSKTERVDVMKDKEFKLDKLEETEGVDTMKDKGLRCGIGSKILLDLPRYKSTRS